MRKVPKKPSSIIAAVLAIAVHVALGLFLLFGVRWQNKSAEPMLVELVPPMLQTQSAPPPKPVVKPPPEPPPRATPPPVAPPVALPPPPPPPVKAEPRPVAKPEPAKVDIALQARKEKERLEKERLEKERMEKERLEKLKREQDRLVQERRERELRELAKKEADRREREVREVAQREMDRRALEELKVAQDRARQEAEDRQRREAQQRREQEQRAQLAAQQAVQQAAQQAAKNAADRAKAAGDKAFNDYTSRIQAKIRGNVVLPPDIAGNPEGIFSVVQLPTGEIMSAEIRKSSGSRAYDDAVLRAILKSSPLPKPDNPDLFQRDLTLKFRPKE